jgi:hypothetical protein
MDNKIIFLIYFVGYTCSYFSMRWLIRDRIGTEWTIRDRNKGLTFSVISWIGVLLSFGWAIWSYIEDNSDLNKPSKW